MDGRVEQLQEKKRQLLKALAEVSAEIQRLDGTQADVPHYSQIEDAAHETGKELSRMIQQSRLGRWCSPALCRRPVLGVALCASGPPAAGDQIGGRAGRDSRTQSSLLPLSAGFFSLKGFDWASTVVN